MTVNYRAGERPRQKEDLMSDDNTRKPRDLVGGFTRLLDEVFGNLTEAFPPKTETPTKPAQETRAFDAGYARQRIGQVNVTLARLLQKDDVAYLRLPNGGFGWVNVDAEPRLSVAQPGTHVMVAGTVLSRFDGHVQRTWTEEQDTIVIIRPRKKPTA